MTAVHTPPAPDRLAPTPHPAPEVIDAIRPVAPTRLFVACDGPNPERPGEAEKVAATRAVIETEIDWSCQNVRLYSGRNQGCRLGVSRAITWFFEQMEEGIGLEDDCVPHPDFFPYRATLLEPESGIHPAFILRWRHGSHHCLPQIPSRDPQAGA